MNLCCRSGALAFVVRSDRGRDRDHDDVRRPVFADFHLVFPKN